MKLKKIIVFLLIIIIYILLTKFVFLNSDYLKSLLGFHFLNEFGDRPPSLTTIIIFILKNTLIVASIIIFVLALITEESKRTKLKYLFISYLMFLFYILIIKGVTNEFTLDISKSVFQYASTELYWYIGIQEIINIIIFIPLPVFLGFFNLNKYNCMAIFFVPLFIEVVQLVFNWGIFDIMDLFYNTIGLIIGFVISKNTLKN